MKKSLFVPNIMKSALFVGAFSIAITGMTSCSENDLTLGDESESLGIETSPLTVTNDADFLSQYVTNYKSARSRSGENDEIYTMPVAQPEIPAAAVEYKDINAYWFPDEAAKQAALTSKVTVPTEKGLDIIGDMTIYVSSTFTITGAAGANGASGNVKIYVLDGGKIVFKGNYNNGLPFHTDPSTLTIYNFGELAAADLNSPCNIENVTIHSATPVTIDNLGVGTDTRLYAYDGIDVDKLNVYVGAFAYSSCKIVAADEIIIDSSAKVSTGYVSAPTIVLKGNDNPQMLTLRDGGLWEANKIEINNIENTIVGSNDGSYSCIKASEISVNGIDLSNTFKNTYIVCSNWTGDNRASDTSVLTFDASVTLNDTTDIQIIEGDTSACAPKYVKPAPTTPADPEPEPETPVLDIISKVQMDHRHPISATSIDVIGNQAFVSWHERGDNMMGCIEILDITSPNTVTFKAWMETPRSTNDAQAAYDFNHLIYDSRTNSLLTVGDHTKKGGFVAQIKLADVASSGSIAQKMDVMIPRQLPLAASGNSLIRQGEDLYIACAGGYSIFPFGNGENFAIDNKKGEYTHVSECTSLPTDGSAKHLAVYGNKIATIEYTTRTGDSRPALIKLWNADSWINGEPTLTFNVPEFGPTYGKDVIALDDTYIYSCQGANGVAVYDLGGNEVARFQVNDYLTTQNGFTDEQINKMRHSAANGLCVYGNYVFVANGGAGVWVLDKSKNFAPVGHFTDQNKYFSQEQNGEIGASANYVRITNDNYVYVAYGLGGVMVLKFDASAIK